LEDQFVAALLQKPERIRTLPDDARQFFLDDKVLNKIYTRALESSGDNPNILVSHLSLNFQEDPRIPRWLNESAVSDDCFDGLLLDMQIRSMKRVLKQVRGDLTEHLKVKACLKKLEGLRIERYKRLNAKD